MDDIPPGIRRLCVAVAAETYANHGTTEQEPVRNLAFAALLDACSVAGLERVLVNAQRTEDTEVAVLPAGIDEPRVIASLAASLAEALRRMNAGQGDGKRVRLRMAVHEGITVLTPDGFTGQAVRRVCSLVHSAPLHAALAADLDANLVVMLSDQVFDDVTQFKHSGMFRDRFRRAEVTIPGDGYLDAGWIYIPEHTTQ